MKKNHVYVSTLLLIGSGVVLESCALNQKMNKNLVGQYTATEHPPLKPEVYSGYLTLEIAKNGKFSIYDWSGNPGISGKLTEKKDNQLYLKSKKTDFDPPVTWEDLKRKDTISYEILDDQNLKLTFQGADLIFKRDE